MSSPNLIDGLTAIGLALDEADRARLEAYIALIGKWNQVYNLTAIRDPQRMLVEHLLDSLVVVPHVRPARVLDIGSGAGLPGIPLAIARPGWSVTLLDSNHKKAVFLQQAKIELRLDNVEVACTRVEQFASSEKFDTVISRAFSEAQHFARVALPHLAAEGRMLAMKGIYPHEELAQLPAAVAMREVVTLSVPGLAAARSLVVMTKA